MLNSYTLPVLKSAAIIITVSLLFSCDHGRKDETADVLKDVESYMNDKPDSALTVLQSISKETLSSKELKARHALLLSQALDKNYIDLQSDSIIAPAVKYFEKTKDYESIFKSYYYHGRVLFNADRNIEAMQVYLKAEELSEKVTDNFAIGLLCAQIGVLNSKYFNYAKAAEYYHKAKEYYRQAGKDTHVHLCDLDLGQAYYESGQKEKGTALYMDCLDWAHSIGYQAVFESCLDQLFLYSMKDDRPEIIDQCIDKYSITSFHPSSMISLGLAYKHASDGDYQKYESYIKKAWDEAENEQDTTCIKFTEYKVLRHKGDDKRAIVKLEWLLHHEDGLIRSLVKEPLLEAKVSHLDAYNTKSKETIENQELTMNVIILSCMVALLASAFIIVLIRSRLMKRTEEKERYADMYESTLAERDALSEMLETQTVSEETRAIVTQRLEILNSIITSHISERDADIKKADKELDKLIGDRDSFIASTRATMEMSHHAFFNYLREKELTDWEINYCCLYLIGLKGKDIGDYINLKRHYSYGSAIRMKLGLTENDTNLSLYLKKMLKNM
ncbi:MAG: hypothetical protein IJ402_06150 [Bacteroidales bacterium]|nr:hypothetical protein [Bacteroidales bacterium]